MDAGKLPGAYLSSDVDVNYNSCWLSGDLRVTLRCAKSNHLVRAGDYLNRSLAILDAFPLEVLQEGGVIVTPVHERVRDARVGESLEDHRRGGVHPGGVPSPSGCAGRAGKRSL